MPEVIAHRGASQDRPENTFAAFDLALEQGADTLEMDLHTTRDGHPVVLHDPTLLRTHGDPRAVAETDLAELPDLPTLTQVLDRYAGRVGLLLEAKGPAAAVAQQAQGIPGVVVQSFDRVGLRRAKGVVTAPLFAKRPTTRQLDRAARHAEGIGVPREVVDAELVARVRLRGLRLRVFTVNEPTDLERLTALGVDGLITDVPLLARRTAPLEVAA